MGLFGGNKSKIITDCYTRSEVPGRTIEKSLGLVKHREGSYKISKDIDGIFEYFLEKAKENGANAIVNMRMITGSNQESGKIHIDEVYIIVYGEAVVLK